MTSPLGMTKCTFVHKFHLTTTQYLTSRSQQYVTLPALIPSIVSFFKQVFLFHLFQIPATAYTIVNLHAHEEKESQKESDCKRRR